MLNGKNVTGFTNTLEDAAGLSKALPSLVEDMLKEQGGQLFKMFERLISPKRTGGAWAS